MYYNCRFGSARAVNRRYISDCVPLKTRMQASAGFVSASALGMACGPALAGLLQTNFKIYKITFNQNTLPGWVMTVAWLVYLIWLWISFVEPSREFEENHTTNQSNAGTSILMISTFLLRSCKIVNPYHSSNFIVNLHRKSSTTALSLNYYIHSVKLQYKESKLTPFSLTSRQQRT